MSDGNEATSAEAGMPTSEHMGKMLQLLEVQQQQQIKLQEAMMQQMEQLNALQRENSTLREAANTPEGDNATTNSIPEQPKYKSKKPDRPTIDRDLDDREWALILDKWTRYKTMCNIKPENVEMIRLELRAACSDDVDKLLFEFVGATVLDSCTEKELLDHIKSVTVKHTHKEVHRMEFDRLVQGEESVVKYVAKLKSKAFLCQFEVESRCADCTTVVKISYSEDMIATRLVAGLRNQEHKRKVLAEAATLTTLDAKIKRLQVLETTDLSTSALQTPTAISESAAAKSQYKKSKAIKPETADIEDNNLTRCRWCNMTSHPNGKSLQRVNCTARNKTCFLCKKKGHLAVVCENSEAAATLENRTPEGDADTIPSHSSVSFAFGMEEDFRHLRKKSSDP